MATARARTRRGDLPERRRAVQHGACRRAAGRLHRHRHGLPRRPRVWDLAYLAYRLCSFCSDSPTPGGLDPLRRLDSLLQAYGEDAPAAADVLATMVPRLDELADWTDRHAEDSRQPELHAHADLYRRDARRLPQL
ncbi:hypothetical protein [Cellulomonas denverensis]|uniref:hypothetical protein n=1 Tax=Cellulomonas denverensis TaxID=264297 RepID=UPI0035E6E148